MNHRQVGSLSAALLRAALFAAAMAVWTGCVSSIPTGKAIHIHMTGSRTNPEGRNPYEIEKVLPNSKGVCRGAANQREDCLPDVSWELKGPDLPKGWHVEVRIKTGAPKQCFAQAPYNIANDEPVQSGPVSSVCNTWDVWPYDVILVDGSGAEKGREDPLVVINH